MDQELALAILLSGKTALLTGPAGTGKTYLLNNFVTQARAVGKKVAVTATTGLAATHLGGNTIHSWSGIGVNDDLPDNFFDRLSKTRRETIEKTDVLIIDGKSPCCFKLSCQYAAYCSGCYPPASPPIRWY